MTTLATLVVKIVGDVADYTSAIQQSTEMTESFAGTAVNGLSAVGGTIVAGALAAGAAAVTGLGVAAWEAGNQVDNAMDIVVARTGATGNALNNLGSSFKNVLADVPTDANIAAEVIAALNSKLGITGPLLEDNSAKLLRMTDMLGGDVQSNAGLFTRVIGDWSVPLDRSSKLLDVLFAASQKTGTGVDSLMQNVVQFGAPLRNMGFDLTDSIAMFAKWEKEGVNAELVMGSLRIAAGKFAAENKPLKAGLEETMMAIKGAASNSEALSIAMDVFGSRAAGDMSAAIREGRFDIEDLSAALWDTGDVINDTAKEMMDWPEKWKLFTNGLTVSLAPLGGTMMNIAGMAMEMLNSFLSRPETQIFIQQLADGIASFANTVIAYLPQVVQWFQAAFGWLEQNQGVIVAALAMIGAAVVTFAVTSLAAAIPAIGAFIGVAWPVVLVLGLIGGAAYLLYEAWTNNWGGIQEKMGAVWAWMQPIFEQLKNWFQNELPIHITALGILWETALLPKIQAVWSWMSSTLFPFFKELATFIGLNFLTSTSNLASTWQTTLYPALEKIVGFLQAYVFPAIKRVNDMFFPWQTAIQGVSGAIREVTGWLATMNSAMAAVKLPKMLTPGSPTPFENGLRGIGDALDGLNGKSLPALRTSLNFDTAGVGAIGAQISPRIANGQQSSASAREALTFNYYDQAVVSSNRENEIIDKLGPAFVEFLRQKGLL